MNITDILTITNCPQPKIDMHYTVSTTIDVNKVDPEVIDAKIGNIMGDISDYDLNKKIENQWGNSYSSDMGEISLKMMTNRISIDTLYIDDNQIISDFINILSNNSIHEPRGDINPLKNDMDLYSKILMVSNIYQMNFRTSSNMICLLDSTYYGNFYNRLNSLIKIIPFINLGNKVYIYQTTDVKSITSMGYSLFKTSVNNKEFYKIHHPNEYKSLYFTVN